MRSDELCTVSKYLKHHLKLGNRLIQTCELSQKVGVSLLFEYIGLQVDVPDSEKLKSNIQIHRLLRQNLNIIIYLNEN